MRKKMSFALAILLVLLLLAGCGGDTAQSTATSAAGSAEATTEDSTPAETGDGTATKIQFASWQWEEAGFGDFYRKVAADFNEKYPEYEIEEVSLPSAQFFDKMLTDIAAGAPPDIMMYNETRIDQLIQEGTLAALDEYLSEETMNHLNNEYSPAQQNFPIAQNGHVYGLYMMLTSHQLMYNEAMLKEAGIDVPTTPQEFIDAAIALNDPPNQYGYGFMTLAEEAFYGDITMWAIGEDPDIYKDGKFQFNTPGVATALANYKTMFDNEVTPMGVPKATYRQMFADGQVAFLIDGPWQYSFVQSLSEEMAANVRTAVVPFPTKLSAAADNVMTIPSGAKNIEGAMKYLEMCASPEYQGEFAMMTNTTPGMASAVPQDWLEENPWFSAYVDGAAGATTTASMSYGSIEEQIRKIVIDYCQEILYNNADIEQTLQTIQDEVDALAAANGLDGSAGAASEAGDDSAAE